MRFLLYNIRYGTALKCRRRFPWSGLFQRTHRYLPNLIEFMQPLAPDIVGLVEVDAGSYRANRRNQAQDIAEALGHYHYYRCKYDESGWANRLPVFSKQGNAFLARDTIADEQYHYFSDGMKRLVIELELENLTIFLVHLALTYRARHSQLGDLYSLVKDADKPLIVAGDFNAHWGDREIRLFLAATGLVNPNRENAPTFPSWNPRRQLDFILHSPEIQTERFWIPQVALSDHCPLVLDFSL